MENKTIVILGNGIAGNTAASAIRNIDKTVPITIVSEEPLPLYCACALPGFLSGNITKEALFMKDYKAYLRDNIKTVLGWKAISIDQKQKHSNLRRNGVFDAISYDKLIIATGSRAIIPLVNAHKIKGVFTLKTFMDTQQIYIIPQKEP